jgi:nucleotide-binding universal stress UspA family protein
MIKAILVLADETPRFETTLAFAIELCRKFGAHVDALHFRPDPLTLLPIADEGVPPDLLDEIRKAAAAAADERESAARAIFDRRTKAASVSAGWQVSTGEEIDVATTAARLHDLTVFGRPDDSVEPQWRTIVHAVLFGSGRPVLLLPRTPPSSLGDQVAVAWNGSAEASRAVAESLPLLQQARQVTVLSAGAVDPYASTAGLVGYLARHDVRAVAREFESAHESIGNALLDQAKLAHAELLVMGAYSHSRLREVILGGATREILHDADLPVLMAH